jgi:GT2 family glycosyltransferase
MSDKVSIIILNWNGLKDTLECLESLKKITYSNYEVIVVDNGSAGNDADVIEGKYPRYVKLIRNDHNYGFAEGNNIAIKWAQQNSNPDFFLLLNNDTVVNNNFLKELIRVAQSDDAYGILGSKIRYFDHPDIIQNAGGKINLGIGVVRQIGFKQKDVGQYDQTKVTDCVSGCCFLIKKQVINKIGLLDDKYFCYYEETDYCLRARRAGYKVVVVPSSEIRHKKQLKKRGFDSYSEVNFNSQAYYYSARNKFIFMKNHATKKQLLTFYVFLFGFDFWITCFVCLFYHRNFKQFLAFLQGTIKGVSYHIN